MERNPMLFKIVARGSLETLAYHSFINIEPEKYKKLKKNVWQLAPVYSTIFLNISFHFENQNKTASESSKHWRTATWLTKKHTHAHVIFTRGNNLPSRRNTSCHSLHI